MVMDRPPGPVLMLREVRPPQPHTKHSLYRFHVLVPCTSTSFQRQLQPIFQNGMH